MHKYISAVFFSALLIGCSSGEVNNATVENPNSGEFGEAGATVTKSYAYDFETGAFDGAWFVSHSGKCHMDSVSEEYSWAIPSAWGHAIANGQEPVGMPVGIVRMIEGEDSVNFEAGVLVSDSLGAPEDGVVRYLEPGSVLKVFHYGPYQRLSDVPPVLEEYMEDNDIERNGEAWAEYVSDPMTVVPDSILTVIYQPIK